VVKTLGSWNHVAVRGGCKEAIAINLWYGLIFGVSKRYHTIPGSRCKTVSAVGEYPAGVGLVVTELILIAGDSHER
jgi:hypothetical protein